MYHIMTNKENKLSVKQKLTGNYHQVTLSFDNSGNNFDSANELRWRRLAEKKSKTDVKEQRG